MCVCACVRGGALPVPDVELRGYEANGLYTLPGYLPSFVLFVMAHPPSLRASHSFFTEELPRRLIIGLGALCVVVVVVFT